MREAETTIRFDGDVTSVRSRLPGRHNAINIAAAFACGRALGLDNEIVVAGLESASAPPGRWELVDAGQSFDVVVDYAHTPDGIAQFLESARAITIARGTSLRTVFGPVGVQDPAKMEGCARSAATLSNHLILTTGSAPRSARILRIRELRDAARSAQRLEVVLERREAIARAIASAHSGDVVAILGLGALRRIVLDAAGTMYPSDDGQTAHDALTASRQCVL
jgi:UDP-N-acetylmuramoyl-L-alanyl-D-glutamate--2,6-diaminopimelate ligase